MKIEKEKLVTAFVSAKRTLKSFGKYQVLNALGYNLPLKQSLHLKSEEGKRVTKYLTKLKRSIENASSFLWNIIHYK